LEKEHPLNVSLRVCICTDLWLGAHSGGVERIVKFAENVSIQGAKVYLVDRSIKKSPSALVLDYDTYHIVENGQITERHYPVYTRFILPGLVKFVQESINHLISQMTRTTVSEACYSYLADPDLLVKLFFVCKTERIDLIQCEFPFTSFSSWIIKKITGIPLVYDAHNIESDRIGTMANVNKLHVSLMKKLEIKCCNLCDLVFTVSKSDRARLISWGIPEKKITIIPNSAELKKFSPSINGKEIRNKLGLNNAFLIIFHGTLDYAPNMEAVRILIEIFPKILEKYSNVYLFLVGKNPPKISNPHIIVTGFVENLAEYLAAADLAVVPLMSGGGTKLKMLEYLASGKAIVSTYKAAEGLDLENGKDLLMSKYPDAEFIQLVLSCIKDENLRKSLAVNARKKAELLYDWELNAEKAVCVYQALIEKQD